MKNKLFRSVKIEIITYVVVSLVLSLITTLVITLGLFMLREFIKKDNAGYLNQANNTGSAFGITGSGTGGDVSVDGSIRSDNEAAANKQLTLNNILRYRDESKIKLTENSRFAWFIILEIIVCFIFFFAVYFMFFTKRITDYFEKLDRGIEEFSEGNFDVDFEVRNEDELSNMARNLNRTTGEIKRILDKERNEEKNRKEFITSIAHDLRTPLTSVIGYLQLVMAKSYESRKDEEILIKNEEYVRIAYDKAMRLQGLIEELFSFTKTDSTELRLHLGELMARAVANLLTNGIKYGRDGKKLLIELYQEDEKSDLHLQIINYGRLIPKKDIEHIFDKFYRVEESRSVETGGTGLGLAITKNIVSLHGGSINVKSDLNGTVFEIILPVK